jgi:hypothetical protein
MKVDLTEFLLRQVNTQRAVIKDMQGIIDDYAKMFDRSNKLIGDYIALLDDFLRGQRLMPKGANNE